jgi:hypothetical protein
LLLQQLEEPALGLLIICLDKPETAIRHLFRHRFADDDFEVLLLVFPFPYVTAVDAYCQRRPRTW